MAEVIQAGQIAPDFTLKNQWGEDVTLHKLRGKKVLLSWHPLAWTGVCTDQMRGLERDYARFAEKNTVVLGLSVDPLPSKAAWSKVLALRELQILTDFLPLGEVTKAYGLFSEEHGASKRANVLVGEDGKVLWVKKYPIPVLPDAEEILALL